MYIGKITKEKELGHLLKVEKVILEVSSWKDENCYQLTLELENLNTGGLWREPLKTVFAKPDKEFEKKFFKELFSLQFPSSCDGTQE